VSDLQGPRLLEGSERAVTVRSTTIDGLLRWREQYTKVELVGEATVGEASCWQLTMTPAEGNPETWYLDKGTGLLVKMTMTLSHVMGQVPVEATFGDYRTVDGITMPFRSTQKVLMQEMLTVLETVEHNVELPADAFQPPPEVLALVAKATPPPVPTALSGS
jgi:outer membrane lipoprotein-sorting protein